MVSKQSSTKSAVNAPKAAPPQQEIDLSLSPAIKFIIFQLVLIATKAGKIPDWGLIALAIGLTKDSADSVRQLYDRESDIILQGERQVGLGMAVWNNENGVYEPSDSVRMDG